MHYYIDGYNLLFRLMHADDNLQSQREQIIYDLSKKIALVKIDASIVFDSTFQVGDRSRSHFNDLEILFTAEGETADEFILDELRNVTSPRQETVITSDKKLAWQARRRLANTETVEDFIIWLDKCYKKKIKQQRKVAEKPANLLQSSKPAPIISSSKPSIPTSNASHDECQCYYEQIFEKKFQELLDQEKSHQAKTEKLKTKKKKPSTKAKKVHSTQEEVYDEMKRWLLLFEDRLSN